MGYDILSDDLFDESDSKKATKKSKKDSKSGGGGKKFPPFSLSPMVIHIALIVILLLVILFLLFSNFSFDMGGEEKKEKDSLTFLGKLSGLTENYSGDLSLSSSEFVLNTPNARFKETKKEVSIESFNGTIGFENESIVFKGEAEIIEFGSNTFRLEGDSFELLSKGKTTLNLFFENITLDFSDGTFLINDHLRHEFSESKATLENYNFSLSYDGTFSISGTAEHAEISSPEEQVSVTYGNPDE
jgi:hypothetical protein